MKQITKKVIKEYIQSKLKSDDRWAKKALITIYNYQTAEEKATEESRVHNNIGFTGYDAEFLSKLAFQLKHKHFLSKKQMDILHKMMPKYWRQIMEASNQDKLHELIRKSVDSKQLSLNLENS